MQIIQSCRDWKKYSIAEYYVMQEFVMQPFLVLGSQSMADRIFEQLSVRNLISCQSINYTFIGFAKVISAFQ